MNDISLSAKLLSASQEQLDLAIRYPCSPGYDQKIKGKHKEQSNRNETSSL